MEIQRGLQPVGRKTSVALGYFDGVHRGHEAILERTVAYAKRMALCPTVFTFDFGDARPGDKGAHDLLSAADRYRAFERLGIELCVVADFHEVQNLTDREFIEQVLGHGCLNAAMVCCGEDFRYGKGRGGDVATMRRLAGPLGIQVKVEPFVIDDGVIRTTRIKRLVAEGDMPLANRLLGRNYTLYLPIEEREERKHLAAIRQMLDMSLLLPKYGVYQSRVQTGVLTGDGWQDAVTYIGSRPSVSDGERVVADTELLEEDAVLLMEDGPVAVELLRLLRPEEQFKNKSELKKAVAADIQRAKLRS